MVELNAADVQRLRSLMDAFWAGDDNTGPEIFSLIDKNGNGKIDAAELGAAMSQVTNQRLDAETVNGMIQRADTNKDGVIDLNEFISQLKEDRDG